MIDKGELVMLGVIQEQHADRCLLFQQWKQLDFPIVQDLLNTNGIAVVPVYVAIDEHGIVRGRPRSPRNFASEFVNQTYPAPEQPAGQIAREDDTVEAWRDRLKSQGSPDHQLGLADARMNWDRSREAVTQSVAAYKQLAESFPQRSDLQFRLGAANRLLYELDSQADSNRFDSAVQHWEQALKLNPNQYIYRRRIEQYGPRLKKPYSFYDWVTQAREELTARGETPQLLAVEPNGAEFAERARTMLVDDSGTEPDPEDQIIRDQGKLVKTHVNFVPTHPKPGDVVAVHIGFSVTSVAKWNHETTPLKLWMEDPQGKAKLSAGLMLDPTPHAQSESQTPISMSFEVQIPESQQGELRLEGYGLFNICEDENGTCIYRRRDVEVRIPVETADD